MHLALGTSPPSAVRQVSDRPVMVANTVAEFDQLLEYYLEKQRKGKSCDITIPFHSLYSLVLIDPLLHLGYDNKLYAVCFLLRFLLHIVAIYSTTGMKYLRFLWCEARLHILPFHATSFCISCCEWMGGRRHKGEGEI